MSDRIERVARAITIAEGDDPDGHTGSLLNEAEVWWQHRIPQARAAIEVMREPDEVMIQRAYEAVEIDDRWQIEDGRDFLKAYHAVIDEALK